MSGRSLAATEHLPFTFTSALNVHMKIFDNQQVEEQSEEEVLLEEANEFAHRRSLRKKHRIMKNKN